MTTPSTPSRRLTRIAAATLIAASLFLTACNISMAGGLFSGGLGVLIVLLLLAMPVTQVGCPEEDDDDNSTSDMSVGPCLSPPPPVDFGPCLSFAPPDMEVGPCLTPPAPDLGPCLSLPPDMNSSDMGTTDMGEMGALESSPDRQEILDKMRDRLPADVLAALGDDEQGQG